jgi:microcystin-dependent protein
MAEQPPAVFRRSSFARQVSAGLNPPWSQLDAELYDLFDAYMRLRAQVATVVKADGTLQGVADATALSLRWEQQSTATASQTVFTVPTYDTALDTIVVTAAGLRIAPSLVTKSSATTVTLPAQLVGTIVVFDAYANGAGLLSRLASVSPGDGASLIGVRDAAGYWTGATVEDVLAEIGTKLITPTFLTTLLGLSDYLLRAGGTMTGDIDMAGTRLLNLAAPTANGHAIRFEDFTAVNVISLIGATLAATYVTKAGDTMTGALKGPDPVAATDYTTKQWVEALFTSSLPPGMIVSYSGASAPAGWALANGQAASRTDPAYAALHTLYAGQGYPFGNGNGSTTFNLPDTRQRTIINAGAGALGQGISGTGVVAGGTPLTSRTVGQWAGEENHTMTLAELAAHTHVYRWGISSGAGPGPDGEAPVGDNTYSASTDSTGSATPFNVMCPWVCPGPAIVKL